MIKNERQHRITKANAEKFRATLKELAATPRPKSVHPKLWEAQKAGLKSQLQDLVAELHEYERLKTGAPGSQSTVPLNIPHTYTLSIESTAIE